MPTKAELYAQMAEKMATQLTGSWQEWAGFLTTASRLYKYPFHEQLMIYAQRPDATACAEYDLWNEKMGRYVRRGSKGIALVDDSGDRPRLRYVFDISDTGTREHACEGRRTIPRDEERRHRGGDRRGKGRDQNARRKNRQGRGLHHPDERGHAPRGGDREGLPYPAEVSEGVRKDQKAAAVSG